MTRPLPGPVQRLRRNRLGLLGILLIGLLAVSTGLVRDAAGVQLATAVDQNWRGSYDLLIRPPGQRLDLEQTAGLVEPNFLDFAGAGGISLNDLDAIRALPGVEVAAPVATLGNISYMAAAPVTYVASNSLPSQPTLYRVTVRATSSDGLSEILVQEQTGLVLLGPAQDLDRGVFLHDANSMTWDDDGLDLSWEVLPPISSPLMAVDPAAERALLGKAGAHLHALESVAAGADPPTAGTFDLGLIPAQFEAQARAVRSLASEQATRGRPIVPVVVSSSLYAPLTVSMTVEQLGQPLNDYPEASSLAEGLEEALAAAGDGATALGTSTLDAGDLLRPFNAPWLSIAWPGSELTQFPTGAFAMAPDLAPRLADRPAYAPVAPRRAGALSFRIEPHGPAIMPGASGETSPGSAPVRAGIEPTYRTLQEVDFPMLEEFSPTWDLDRPFVFAPLAEFDLASLDLPHNPLTYVPLGAYEPPATELIDPAAGVSANPGPMNPTLHPAGLITVPPLAITDLRSAQLLRGERPIDAIRVRVSGLDRFDAMGIARVESVASAIARLGLDVDIVAGSSPQPVEIYVPDYLVREAADADLGWVSQEWTTLGAAERVSQGMGRTNIALMGMGVLAAMAFAVGLQLLQLATRMREVAILGTLGWSRRRIIRWLAAESMVAAALVMGMGLAAWLLAGADNSGSLATVAILGATFPVAALVSGSVVLGAADSHTAGRGDARSVATGAVRSAGKYGVRAALSRPLRLVTLAVSVAIAAGCVSVGVLLFITSAATVGATNLAGAISGLLAPYQLTLLTGVALTGGVLSGVLLRTDLTARRQELLVLSASGWGNAAVRRMLTAHRLVAAVPAGIMAALVAALLAGPLAVVPATAAAALAAVVAVASLALEAQVSARSLETARR